jgi:hypothetical protein
MDRQVDKQEGRWPAGCGSQARLLGQESIAGLQLVAQEWERPSDNRTSLRNRKARPDMCKNPHCWFFLPAPAKGQTLTEESNDTKNEKRKAVSIITINTSKLGARNCSKHLTLQAFDFHNSPSRQVLLLSSILHMGKPRHGELSANRELSGRGGIWHRKFKSRAKIFIKPATQLTPDLKTHWAPAGCPVLISIPDSWVLGSPAWALRLGDCYL